MINSVKLKNKNTEQLNISVCSYNIFWKVMDNISSPLINYIGKKNINKLKDNIIKNIYLIKNYYNPYFYCFQEPILFECIIELFEKKNYEHYIGYSKPEYILTIWNNNYFTKKIVLDGEFESGRPFTLFIFEDNRFKTKPQFILINIHSGHRKDTLQNIFIPIQQLITANEKLINKFNILRIIITGDFNRDIGQEIFINNSISKLLINKNIFYFNPYISNNKTCCNIEGYGYNKNYDQTIDTLEQPILIYPLNKEKWYKSKSSDHIAILSILKNIY